VAAPAPSEPTSADPKPQRGPPTPPEPMRQPKILRVREAAVTMPAAADMPRRAEDNAPAQRAMAPPATATPSAAAQVRSAAAFNAGAAPTWQGLLLGHLEQFKRYPGMAQQHGQQGVVYLRFTMNREGEVLSAKIERSSGYDLLDEETLALIRRAQPLPKPPPEVAGDTLELTVPVEFFLRGR
jgi:protein TonB